MVFVSKKAQKDNGFTVAVLLSTKATSGDVGLEIECEGNKFEKENPVAPWGYHSDGSLRGADNAEYVLRKPVKFDEVDDSLEKLWTMFQNTGTVLDESNRTSVHVHLNVQNFYLNRLTSFMAMYYVLEEVLTQWCGEYRVGNLFCLRAKDAPALVTSARQFIASNGQELFKENIHHYAALNLFALQKFGSLEFRTLRGVPDRQVISDWVAILRRIYDMSAEFSDPRELCYRFSGEGPLAFYELLLGDKAAAVRQAIGWSHDQIRDSMYEGIRLAQDICYARDWDVYQTVDIRPDPFGRSIKKVMQSMGNNGEGAIMDIEAYGNALNFASPSQSAAQASAQATAQAYAELLDQFPPAPVVHSAPAPNPDWFTND